MLLNSTIGKQNNYFLTGINNELAMIFHKVTNKQMGCLTESNKKLLQGCDSENNAIHKLQ